MLDSLNKEQRFSFLLGEMSYDPMYQKDMDAAYHCVVKLLKGNKIMYKFSDKGAEFLFSLEEAGKVKLMPYKDSKGKWTIGKGHLIKANEQYLMKGIALSKAKELFTEDTAGSSGAINSLVKVPLTQYQFDALVVFIFNIGEAHFKSSTVLKLLNAGDFKGAEKHFDDWNKQTLNGKLAFCQGLQNRRDEEQELFNHGDYEKQR